MTDPSPSTAEVGFQSAFEMRGVLEQGSITSLEIVKTLLRRVEEADTRGPGLHAVVATCPMGSRLHRYWMLNADRAGSAAPCTAFRRS